MNGGLDFIVNTTTNVDQRRANVLALEDGRFLITYWSREEPGTGTAKDMILGQLYNADGTRLDGEFVINEGPGIAGGATPGTPHEMIQTLDGRILTIYSNEPDVLTDGITAGFLDIATGPKTFSGTSGKDQFGATRFADNLVGRGGNDVLDGGRGNDKISGGDGADRLVGGTGDDTVTGGQGNDTLLGEKGADVLRGGTNADVLDGGLGFDRLEGGTGADRFVIGSLAAGQDVIEDFEIAFDRIDVSGFDADQATSTVQDRFVFAGVGPVTTAGSIWLEQRGANVVVHLETDGDVGSELRIRLLNANSAELTADHFIV